MGVEQGSHVRKFIMQLGSIELLNVNAQPLRNINLIRQKPIERSMQSVLASTEENKKVSFQLHKC
jgi:hypothetical protein